MSSYRDDTRETVVVSDRTWMNVLGLAVDRVKLADTTFYHLSVLTTETMQAQDTVYQGSTGYLIREVVRVADATHSQRTAQAWVTEQIKVRDQGFTIVTEQVLEQVRMIDQAFSQVGAVMHEQLQVQDSDRSQRKVLAVVKERVRVIDRASAVSTVMLQESITVAEHVTGKLHAYEMVFEQCKLYDTDLSKIQSIVVLLDHIKIEDRIFGKLTAHNHVHEYVFVEDELPGWSDLGVVWTAHTDTWAMSRYEHIGLKGLSVLNGQLYGWNDQGVWTYADHPEHIQATVTTAPIDFGESLVHPVAAYFEYSLSGVEKALHVAVKTTQPGQMAQYKYTMLREQSDHLTNGRIVFGRGLRGRHFAFDIEIHGNTGQINALSIDFSKTTRRI